MSARTRQRLRRENIRHRCLRCEPLEQRRLLSLDAPAFFPDAAPSANFTFVSADPDDLIPFDANSQLVEGAVPFDINAMVDAGTASLTSTPIDIGSLINVFDDNTGTLARSASVNPAYVQVVFTEPRTLKEFRTWFSHTWGDPSHRWMIETADTQVDMDLKIGSHATVVPWTGTPSDQYSIATLAEPVRARLVRLTVERLTGDDYVHVNEWSIYGGATMAALEVRPASATLEQYDQLQFDAVGTDTDGWEHDLTDQVQWSILEPDVATVDAGGLVTAMAVGNTQVIAAVDALSASAQLDVVPWIPGPVDLNATFIERTPRYDYDSPKNAPEPGDLVTFSGHVRCWGDFVSEVNYRWTIDGVTVETGTLTDLIPGQERVVDYAWNWLDGNHTVEFTVDPDGRIAETSEVNNTVEDRANGLAVGFWVEESVHAYFHEHQHELGIGSNSWEDWARRQMARWNEYCENAVYPTSPQGVLDRVRIDKIVVVPDGALPLNGGLASNHPDTSDKTVDLMWGFPATLLNGSMYTDHTNLWESNAFYYEGSLIHELGHARYLIDNYGFDVANNDSVQQVQIYEDGQPVAGSDWMPFLAWDSVLYYNQNGGVMTGPWRAWSPYEAAAFNLIAGQRASQGNYNAPGNIGVFLQDLPENNHVRFVDAAGQPLVGANVRVYQAQPGAGWYGKTIDNTYELEYTTDADGYAHMPQNPFADGPIVHTYGQANGIAVLRIEHADDLWFRFMEVPDFNLQYWQGNTEDAYYTVELPQRGGAAEIEVRGYGQVIVDGDTTPDPADHTDFGRVELDGESRTRQFVVKNRGGTELQLIGSRVIVDGEHASDFQVLNMPDYRVAPQTISTFQVRFTPSGPGVRRATITVTNDDADENPYTFDVQGIGGVTQIVGRHIFYNDSPLDGHDPTANQADDAAIADGKTALLPGQTATSANYTNYSKGINGIMVDISGLADPDNLSIADFEFLIGDGNQWSTAPDPLSVDVRVGEGAGDSGRVTLIWEDNSIKNQWLQVIVKDTTNTGLAEADIFSFAHAPSTWQGGEDVWLALNWHDGLAGGNQPPILSEMVIDIADSVVRVEQDFVSSGSGPAGSVAIGESQSTELQVNATLEVSSGVSIGPQGTLSGSGTVEVGDSIHIEGSLLPGTGVGILTVEGDVDMDAGSTFTVELSGSGMPVAGINNDVLATVDLTLTGNPALQLDWLAGEVGDGLFGGIYTIATYSGTLTGTFAAPTLTAAYTGSDAFVYIDTSYGTGGIDYGSGTNDAITMKLKDLIIGDANLDGDVDVWQFNGSGDAQVLSSNLGSTAGMTWSDGDFNFDGDVDVWQFDGNGDAQLLSTNLGKSVDMALQQAVMEGQDVIEPLTADLDWQYEFQSTQSKATKRKDVEATVDLLLAIAWQ